MDKKLEETKEQKEQKTKRLQTELDKKKAFLHKMVDDITILDYVEADTRMRDVAGQSQVFHRILIEKNGNIMIGPKCHHDLHEFDDDEEDGF